MHRTFVRLTAALLLIASASTVWAFSTGPPASRTNARPVGTYPAENNCTTGCHTGSALNDPNGKLEIIGVPFSVVAGQSYPLKVRLSYSLADTTGASNPLWGFELTAVNAADGKGIGTLVPSAPGSGPAYPDSLLIKTATSGTFSTSNRQYLEQSVFSTRLDQPGPVEWNFTWVAPPAAGGRVLFYAAGNAANGNNSNSGDHIFTASDSTETIGPGVPAASAQARVAMVLLLVSAGAGALIVRRRTA